jgi:hypothetical protein
MLATGNSAGTAKIPSLSAGDETMALTPDSSTTSSSASAGCNPTLTTAPAPDIDPCSLPASAMHITPPVGGNHKGFDMPFYEAYDPITAGVVDEQHAALLLHEFNTKFILSFPFVVITDGLPTLRRDHPFLLHAILTVTSYASPQIQHELADELKRQVARLVEHSQKGLGMLQGLMVYVAWYHTFYHPATQQLGLMIQMCVAMVQDLDGRNLKTSLSNLSEARNLYTTDEKDLRSLAHYRALLGTYCLSVTWVFPTPSAKVYANVRRFAQAWRKRPTLSHTRFMGRCCERLASSPIPTDTLITPFVQLSELIARVNEFFSYDDLEDAEFRGNVMLEMATNNFHVELERISSSMQIKDITKQNGRCTPYLYSICSILMGLVTLRLHCHLTVVWLNECSLHHSLWREKTSPSAFSLSPLRFKMMHRAMTASKSYMEILNDCPRSLLYQLSTTTWTTWFYIVAVTCKLVFLEDTETSADAHVVHLEGEIHNLFAEDERTSRRNLQSEDGTTWDPVRVAKDSNIEQIFLTFRRQLEMALPLDSPPWTKTKKERDSLYAIACLHQMMMQGFTKRLHELVYPTPTPNVGIVDLNPTQPFPALISSVHSSQDCRRPSETSSGATTKLPQAPTASFMHFDTINFDGITLPPWMAMQYPSLDDWIWNTAVDDFTLPTL